MDQDKPDFDDLFEPFELGETPPEPEPTRRRPPPPPPPPEAPTTPTHTHAVNPDVPTVPCPSCGSPNPDFNRHCEQCGARLSQDPLPVAPAPNLRTSPGGRALGVLGAVVLLVALAALIFNVFRGGDEVAESSTTTSSATTIPVAAVELFPASVDASSFLNGHDPEQSTYTGSTETTHQSSSRSNEASPHHQQCYNSKHTFSTTSTGTQTQREFAGYCAHQAYHP